MDVDNGVVKSLPGEESLTDFHPTKSYDKGTVFRVLYDFYPSINFKNSNETCFFLYMLKIRVRYKFL